MVYHNPKSFTDARFGETLALMAERGHQYISGIYVTKESELVYYCPEHDRRHTSTFTNYRRAAHGPPCCGNAAKAEALKGRVFSPETLEKMKIARLSLLGKAQKVKKDLFGVVNHADGEKQGIIADGAKVFFKDMGTDALFLVLRLQSTQSRLWYII